MPKRIDELTPAQKAKMSEWADRWIEIGLRTGEADWGEFERAAKECYRYAGIPWPDVLVRVSSPIVLAFAAPAASLAIELIRRQPKSPNAVDGAVGDAVLDAVGGAVGDAVGDAVRGAVGDAVGGAVGRAVDGAVDGAVRGAVWEVIRRAYGHYLGGQFWVSRWYWGGAFTSFFREICKLDLVGDLWDRGRAYEATMKSACWWYPHKHFVMVCQRPTTIQLELVDPQRQRGWNSHRMHCETGPSVAWPDGWGLWYWHGVRVTQQIVERPETITIKQIDAEQNAEVRRVMIERYGQSRYLIDSGAIAIHSDDWGTLYRKEIADDEPLVMVKVVNSTAEPDGSHKDYFLRIDPQCRPMLADGQFGKPQKLTARNAIASTFGLTGDQYRPVRQT